MPRRAARALDAIIATIALLATPGASQGPPLQPGTVVQCVQGAPGPNPPPICSDGN
jgi:hypothetical protein